MMVDVEGELVVDNVSPMVDITILTITNHELVVDINLYNDS